MNRVWNRPPDPVDLLHCFRVLGEPSLPARVLAAGAILDPGDLDRLTARPGDPTPGL
ncbi:MAG: hypothetical protein HOV94_35505, partial [Saccharothrix sp.]|nr:hypothetical protein [Saccharothrix sp.]